jgi:hypothetical protein
MFNILTKYKNLFDYIPLLFLTLFFVTDAEMEKHAVHTTFQMIIRISCLFVFYIMIIYYKHPKSIALIIAILLWIILTYTKQKYIK